MTVSIEARGQNVDLQVDGDIYEEHAECLREMAFCHVRRGMKRLDIHFGETYYISRQGMQCLRETLHALECQGVTVSVQSSFPAG